MAKDKKITIADDAPDPQMIAEARESATEVSKCPACGANLEYSPSECKLVCAYCGYKEDVDLSRHAEEIDLAQLLRSTGEKWDGEMRAYRCENCGAKQLIPRRELAPRCAFCGTSNVVETQDMCGLRPNAVIPFAFDKKAAAKLTSKWMRKRLYAPRRFKRDSSYPEELAGNYYPAFTFDSRTSTAYSGVLGKYYYTTHRDSKGNLHTTRHTRYFAISGTFDHAFDDVFVRATNEKDGKSLAGIEPFDTSHPQSYKSDYLFGFSASQYERDGASCWGEARRRMEDYVRKAILSRYDHDVVQVFNTNMRCFNMTYKYLLLPVYVGHCEYKKKNYNFYVNGQTGKVKGKTPKSPVKILLTVLAGLAVAAGAILLIALNL